MDLDRDGLGKALKSIRNELGLSIEETSFSKAIFMAEVNNQEYLKEIFINDAKEIYGTPIDNYFV